MKSLESVLSKLKKQKVSDDVQVEEGGSNSEETTSLVPEMAKCDGDLTESGTIEEEEEEDCSGSPSVASTTASAVDRRNKRKNFSPRSYRDEELPEKKGKL